MVLVVDPDVRVPEPHKSRLVERITFLRDHVLTQCKLLRERAFSKVNFNTWDPFRPDCDPHVYFKRNGVCVSVDTTTDNQINEDIPHDLVDVFDWVGTNIGMPDVKDITKPGARFTYVYKGEDDEGNHVLYIGSGTLKTIRNNLKKRFRKYGLVEGGQTFVQCLRILNPEAMVNGCFIVGCFTEGHVEHRKYNASALENAIVQYFSMKISYGMRYIITNNYYVYTVTRKRLELRMTKRNVAILMDQSAQNGIDLKMIPELTWLPFTETHAHHLATRRGGGAPRKPTRRGRADDEDDDDDDGGDDDHDDDNDDDDGDDEKPVVSSPRKRIRGRRASERGSCVVAPPVAVNVPPVSRCSGRVRVLTEKGLEYSMSPKRRKK